MARYLRQSNVEQFVDGYLSRLINTNNLRKERPFIDKAIKMLFVFLDKPCCDDSQFETVFSGRDNALTLFLKANLTESFDLRRHRKSLERVKTNLENTLNDLCCDIQVSVDWQNFVTPSTQQLIFEDEYGNQISTIIGGSDPQTVSLKKRKYKICVNTITADVICEVYNITDGNNFIYSPVQSTGIHCDTVFYIINDGESFRVIEQEN